MQCCIWFCGPVTKTATFAVVKHVLLDEKPLGSSWRCGRFTYTTVVPMLWFVKRLKFEVAKADYDLWRPDLCLSVCSQIAVQHITTCARIRTRKLVRRCPQMLLFVELHLTGHRLAQIRKNHQWLNSIVGMVTFA